MKIEELQFVMNLILTDFDYLGSSQTCLTDQPTCTYA